MQSSACPSSSAMLAVSVRTGSNTLAGNCTTFPDTIRTAMVSPMARAVASIAGRWRSNLWRRESPRPTRFPSGTGRAPPPPCRYFARHGSQTCFRQERDRRQNHEGEYQHAGQQALAGRMPLTNDRRQDDQAPESMHHRRNPREQFDQPAIRDGHRHRRVEHGEDRGSHPRGPAIASAPDVVASEPATIGTRLNRPVAAPPAGCQDGSVKKRPMPTVLNAGHDSTTRKMPMSATITAATLPRLARPRAADDHS